jgi:hypothetical protein
MKVHIPSLNGTQSHWVWIEGDSKHDNENNVVESQSLDAESSEPASLFLN